MITTFYLIKVQYVSAMYHAQIIFVWKKKWQFDTTSEQVNISRDVSYSLINWLWSIADVILDQVDMQNGRY